MRNSRNSVARAVYRCSLRLYDRLPLAGMLAGVAVLLGFAMGHAGGLPHQWLSVQGNLTLDTLGDTLRIGLGSLFTRSEADGLYARKSGEVFHRLMPLPYGTTVPKCTLATEGMLYYVHFNNLASQPGYLRTCVVIGDVDAPYAWRSIQVN